MTKVVALTGATGVLGNALARSLAADDFKIALLARDQIKSQALALELANRAESFTCDMSDAYSIGVAFRQIADRLGRVDVLINNAAVFEPFLLEEAPDGRIISSLFTNLVGPVLCVRAALPLMGPGGHIINVSSEAVEVPFPELSVYQAAKAGLEKFGESMSLELAGSGVRVSTVRCGQMKDGRVANQSSLKPTANLMRFMRSASERGVHIATRGTSDYGSVVQVFRSVIASPPDMNIGLVSIRGVSRMPDQA